MAATWYLVKYMADPTRREPRNVGVILEADGVRLAKFLGETSDGRISRRSLTSASLDAEVYSTWVDYYRRKLETDRWGDVQRLESRGRAGNFYTELGGIGIDLPPQPSQALEDLYSRLVAVKEVVTKVSHTALEVSLQEVFRLADIQPKNNVEVDARYSPDGRLTKVKFELGYQNGALHLMEPVKITSLDRTLVKARDLQSRMEAARRAGSAESFVVFYSKSEARKSEQLEEILLPLESEARTVNVDDKENAAGVVASLMGHQ